MLRVLGAVLVAALLAACGTPYNNTYNAPDGQTLLVSKRDWEGYKKYLGKIGSTRDGAFAMGVYQGQSDGWASSTCGHDACYGGSAATDAMRMCRQGGDCVLFATDDQILVNYKLMDE